MTLCFCHHLPSGCSLHWPRPLYLGPSHGCTWCHACGHPPNPGLGHRPHPQQGEHDSPAGCTAGPCELARSSRRNCHHLPRVMSDISGEVRHYPSSLLQAALGSHPSNKSPLRSNLLRIQSGSYTELGESWEDALGWEPGVPAQLCDCGESLSTSEPHSPYYILCLMHPRSIGPLTQPGHLGPPPAHGARPEVAAWRDSDSEKVNSYTVKLGNTNRPRIRGVQKMTKESLEGRAGKGPESGRKSMAKAGR